MQKQTSDKGTARDNLGREVKDSVVKGGGGDGLRGVGVPDEDLGAGGAEEDAGVRGVPRERADGVAVREPHTLAPRHRKHGRRAVAGLVVRDARGVKRLDGALVVAHKRAVAVSLGGQSVLVQKKGREGRKHCGKLAAGGLLDCKACGVATHERDRERPAVRVKERW